MKWKKPKRKEKIFFSLGSIKCTTWISLFSPLSFLLHHVDWWNYLCVYVTDTHSHTRIAQLSFLRLCSKSPYPLAAMLYRQFLSAVLMEHHRFLIPSPSAMFWLLRLCACLRQTAATLAVPVPCERSEWERYSIIPSRAYYYAPPPIESRFASRITIASGERERGLLCVRRSGAWPSLHRLPRFTDKHRKPIKEHDSLCPRIKWRACVCVCLCAGLAEGKMKLFNVSFMLFSSWRPRVFARKHFHNWKRESVPVPPSDIYRIVYARCVRAIKRGEKKENGISLLYRRCC